MQATVTCPVTLGALAVEFEPDADNLPGCWSNQVVIDCPICEGSHVENFATLYMRGTIEAFRCAGRFFVH